MWIWTTFLTSYYVARSLLKRILSLYLYPKAEHVHLPFSLQPIVFFHSITVLWNMSVSKADVICIFESVLLAIFRRKQWLSTDQGATKKKTKKLYLLRSCQLMWVLRIYFGKNRSSHIEPLCVQKKQFFRHIFAVTSPFATPLTLHMWWSFL